MFCDVMFDSSRSLQVPGKGVKTETIISTPKIDIPKQELKIEVMKSGKIGVIDPKLKKPAVVTVKLPPVEDKKPNITVSTSIVTASLNTQRFSSWQGDEASRRHNE